MSDPPTSSGRAVHDGSTSRSLLANAQEADPAAWARLVTLYAPLVAAWCRRWGLAEQEIADVLQEVFAAVARNIASFRRDRPGDTFRGWLSTITRNKLRDHHRKQADQPLAQGGTEAALRLAQVLDPEAAAGDDDAAGDDGADDAAFGCVVRAALEAIRGEFQPQTWQAFWGVVVEGRSAAEVGASLGMRPGAVRVAKSRVLHRLRRELGDFPE
jgi:RNA polymerase sigma-70 factor, ECF subfamily